MPVPAAPLDPQTLNRYSYVFNNPLCYVDSSGEYGLIITALIIVVVAWVAIVSFSSDQWGEDWTEWPTVRQPQNEGPSYRSPTPPPYPKPDDSEIPDRSNLKFPPSDISDKVTPSTPPGLPVGLPLEPPDWWPGQEPEPEWQPVPEPIWRSSPESYFAPIPSDAGQEDLSWLLYYDHEFYGY